MSIRCRAVHMTLNKLSPGDRLQSAILPASPGDVVLIGDGLSLHGEWREWFPQHSVRVLGDELLLIDDARSLVGAIDSPRALVLMMGSAELLGMGGSARPSRAASKLDALLGLATSKVDAGSIAVVAVPQRPAFGTRAA